MCELTTIAFDGEEEEDENENENEIQSPPFKSKETVYSEQGKCGRQCVCQSIKSFSEIFFLTKYSSIKQSNSHFAGFLTKIIFFLCAAVFPTYCCSVSFLNEKC